jgi:long-chain fatty acid transport protein
MIRNKLQTLLLTLLVVSAFSTSVFATDGYFRHGYGIRYSALAGSGVAVSLSSLGAITNPAGIVFINNRYDVNISYFSPAREYTAGIPTSMQGFPLGAKTLESESSTFFFPTLGANWGLNSNMAIGMVIYGNGGMNTDYPEAVFGDPNSPGTGVNLEQLFGGITFAMEITEGHALAVQGLFGWQRFSAKGLWNFSFFSSSPENLTGNEKSTSTGFGFKVGYQGQFGKMIRFGAAYQSKMNMSEFDRYKGLFAEAGDFDVPANWQAGFAVMPNDELTILLDVQQIFYSGVRSIANPMDVVNNSPSLPDGSPNPNFIPLGDADGWGFGWKDMTIVKFGLMYNLPEAWTLYGGYSYGKQPIPETEVMFNILALAVVEHHITLGLSKAINKSHEVMIAFMYAPQGSVVGQNPLIAPPGQQTIELKMSQFQIDIGYGFSIL